MSTPTPTSGVSFKAQQVCEQCHQLLRGGGFPLDCFCGAQEALAGLVELKREADAGPVGPNYAHRLALQWQEAFNACGVVERPKP